MTGIAGAGSVFGVPGAASLVPAAALVAFAAAGGRARRLDALVVGIGLFEASFAAMAWLAHPDFSHWARTWQAVRLDDPRLVAMAAAIVGATFNPWMLFYQQHAVARARRRGEAPAPAASRAETALGALLGQGFTMSIVVIVAATAHAAHRPLSTLGELAAVFVGIAGPGLGYPLFAGGMLASAFVAAVVCLEALVAGSAELLPALRPAHTAWLGPLAIAASALVACGFDDPVGSSVAVQAASGLVSAGFIVVLFRLRANRAKAVRVA